MANWCSVCATLTLKDEETAFRLYNFLEGEKDDRNLHFHEKKDLFGARISRNPNLFQVYINGDVRWALEQDDMIDFAKWLEQCVPASELTMTVTYKEISNDIYGKYVLKDGMLKDYFLDPIKVPTYPDSDDEELICAFYEEVNAMIDATEGKLFYVFVTDSATIKNFGRWNVRIIRQNERYGRRNCLVHKESDPLVEFYDTKQKDDDEWKNGQFVSRYYAETVFENCYNTYKYGLQLDDGIEDWYVDPHDMSAIFRWLRRELPQYEFTVKQLSDLNFFREKEHLEADRIQNALARLIIRKVRNAGNGKCYLGRYNRNEWDQYGLQEYRHGMVYNFQYDFVIPTFDPQIQEWLLEYQHKSGQFSLVEKIGERVQEMNGFTIFWS